MGGGRGGRVGGKREGEARLGFSGQSFSALRFWEPTPFGGVTPGQTSRAGKVNPNQKKGPETGYFLSSPRAFPDPPFLQYDLRTGPVG